MPRRKAFKEPPFDLRAARESHSMSQHDAAELLKTAQSSVSRWEVEGSMPAIYRMAWHLHWKVIALETGKKGKRA